MFYGASTVSLTRGCYRGHDGRFPVTRTRAQWAELLAMWYIVHGATVVAWVCLFVRVWWLSWRKKLDEPCTIRLHPEPFGGKAREIQSEQMVNPRPQFSAQKAPEIQWYGDELEYQIRCYRASRRTGRRSFI